VQTLNPSVSLEQVHIRLPTVKAGPISWSTQPGVTPHAGHHERSVSVPELIGDTSGVADLAVTLTARREAFNLASGEAVTGYTLNHQSPGPLVRAHQHNLVQVTLINESVSDGVTLHWHGVAVPNAADGVAGVTQDPVPLGGQFVYRFRVDRAGTYWYHSHQVSREQVRAGLFGILVRLSASRIRADRDTALEDVALGRSTQCARMVLVALPTALPEEERTQASPPIQSGGTATVRWLRQDVMTSRNASAMSS
jgi:Multicopper oxidase